MPKIEYVPRKFGESALAMIEKANQVMADYAAQGYELTLRQLYYQFVSRGWLANKQTEYKRLGEIVGDARLAGMIDWDHLIDRTWNVQSNSHWSDPESIIQACAESYALDKWEGQSRRVEVWIEKDALVGVIERVCRRLDVPWFSCRGYTSLSEMWAGAMRLKKHIRRGTGVLVIHLGDHDPSGKDMTRDIADRLSLFCGGHIEVDRIALNWDQIERYNPPPNPAKLTDSRAKGYIEEFGDNSWELDALEPRVLEELVEARVRLAVDQDQWDAIKAQEESERDLLLKCSQRWDNVVEMLEQDGD